MASEKGASSNSMDERLTEVRDRVLLEGEEIVAEEMGDQSQVIILTKSRVLIIKAGLTVTGELNGQKTGAFPLNEISSVNFRKGPIGAVIQVCTGNEQSDAHTGTPDNIIIFTGAQRIKKCEAMAARISKAVGKPVAKTENIHRAVKPKEPDSADVMAAEEQAVTTDETPKAGKERKSLAEEMFEEMTQAQPQVVATPTVESVVEEPVTEFVSAIDIDPEPVEEEIEEEEYSLVAEFNPNPNLPKPMARKSKTANKALALFGLLVALVLAGIAVTTPMRMSEDIASTDIDMTELMNNTSALRKESKDITNYRDEVIKILQESNRTSAILENALHKGRCNSSQTSAVLITTEQSWEMMENLTAPAGLAGAKDNIVSGLFIRKTTVGSIPSRAFDPNDISIVLKRFTEADASIKHGLDAIDKMQCDIKKQIEDMQAEKTKR